MISKSWAIKLATEAARTVLSVDQIIVARQAGGPKPPGPNPVSHSCWSFYCICLMSNRTGMKIRWLTLEALGYVQYHSLDTMKIMPKFSANCDSHMMLKCLDFLSTAAFLLCPDITAIRFPQIDLTRASRSILPNFHNTFRWLGCPHLERGSRLLICFAIFSIPQFLIVCSFHITFTLPKILTRFPNFRILQRFAIC